MCQEMADNYELYHAALLETYLPPRYRIIRCPEHFGFAHAVKRGLQVFKTHTQHEHVAYTHTSQNNISG